MSGLRLLLSRVSDWFLILAGAVLLYWSVWTVDVEVARWVIGLCGALLSGAGFWYRHRRRQRCR